MEKLRGAQKEFQISNCLKYPYNKIKYPSKIDDWKTFDKNNSTTAINLLYTKEKEICPAYISK